MGWRSTIHQKCKSYEPHRPTQKRLDEKIKETEKQCKTVPAEVLKMKNPKQINLDMARLREMGF